MAKVKKIKFNEMKTEQEHEESLLEIIDLAQKGEPSFIFAGAFMHPEDKNSTEVGLKVHTNLALTKGLEDEQARMMMMAFQSVLDKQVGLPLAATKQFMNYLEGRIKATGRKAEKYLFWNRIALAIALVLLVASLFTQNLVLHALSWAALLPVAYLTFRLTEYATRYKTLVDFYKALSARKITEINL